MNFNNIYSFFFFAFRETGICQKQNRNLITAYLRAKEYGLISFHVPFRKYSYENYCENLRNI